MYHFNRVLLRTLHAVRRDGADQVPPAEIASHADDDAPEPGEIISFADIA